MDYLKQNKPKFKEKKVKETHHIRDKKCAEAHAPFKKKYKKNHIREKLDNPITVLNSAPPFEVATIEQFKIALMDHKYKRIDSYNSMLFCQMWIDGSYKVRLVNRKTLEEVTFQNSNRVTREELEQMNVVLSHLGKDIFGNPLKDGEDYIEPVVKFTKQYEKKEH